MTLLILSFGVLVAGVLFGTFVYIRADQQKSQYEGIKKWEPYFLSGAGFTAALVALVGIICALFIGSFPDWAPPLLRVLLQAACLLMKVLFFCWLFVWVRWTLPRFRFDQLMRMGWRLMLPLAFLNLLVTGAWILIQKG